MNRLSNNTPEINGVLRGLEKASKIITSTMGGVGKNVLFSDGNLQFTKDGVSVAKRIQFKDPEEDIGAKLLINTTHKTVQECGDGTTLTALLTYEFVNNLFKECQDKSINDVLDYTREEIEKVCKYLVEQSKQIDSYDEVYKIALTSSKSEKIAQLIEQIYRKTGLKANIAVEKSTHFNYTYFEVTEGLSFDTTFVHPGFANSDNGNCSFEKPEILWMDEALSDPKDFMRIIDEYHLKGTPLVLIAPAFSDGFIRYALTNKENHNKLQICLLKYPGWGASVAENKKDLQAFLTNKTKANKVTITPFDLTVYNNPDKKKIRTRVAQLNSKLEVETEDFYIADYQKRISNLNQTSAIIYVGGVTEKNAQEEFDRIEDAVGACKSSLQLGYVAGQGAAFTQYVSTHALSIDEWFKDILKSPALTIFKNGNITQVPSFTPFNVRTRQYDENLIDPTIILISALRNSFALAELLINTSYTLYEQ